ncbi:MAG: S-layer homology domain-containing protein [Symbiobacteriia bacterium]
MKHRVLCVFLVFFMAFLMVFGWQLPLLAAGSPTFSDMAGHWAQAEIETAANLGIVNGYPDGTFKPDRPVSRAEVVKMAVTASGIAPITGVKPRDFQDVVDHWVAQLGYIQAAQQNGIVQATDFPGSNFEPDRLASRQEVALIVNHALHRFVADISGTSSVAFTDIAALPDSVRAAIAEDGTAGIFKGYPDGSFGPDRQITRAEAAAIFNRLRQHVPAKLSLSASAGIAGKMITVTVDVQDALGNRATTLAAKSPHPIELHIQSPDGQPVGSASLADEMERSMFEGRSTFMFMPETSGVYILSADVMPDLSNYILWAAGNLHGHALSSGPVQVQVGELSLSKSDPVYALTMPQPPTADGKQQVIVDILDSSEQRVAITQSTLPVSVQLKAMDTAGRDVPLDVQLVAQGGSANPAYILNGQVIFSVGFPTNTQLPLIYEVDATVSGKQLISLGVD